MLKIISLKASAVLRATQHPSTNSQVNMNHPTAQLVEKETISSLKFPNNEVLTGAAELAERAKKMAYAASLGNLEKHKVQIVFKDDAGLKQVDTTIWGITEKAIILKSNTTIPIHRIVDIIHL